MSKVAVLYTTWPDAESAEAAARILVEERLCACVNILAPMRSIHRWNEGIETASEIPALFKTTTEAAPALGARIKALHPYEIACVLMTPVTEPGRESGFTDWIIASVNVPSD